VFWPLNERCVLNRSKGDFGKLGFKSARDHFFVTFDRLSGWKGLSAKAGYIREVIYQFLNIGRQIANR